MPTCENCGDKFGNWVKIEGRSRNISNRKNCLKCSPFGSRNPIRKSDNGVKYNSSSGYSEEDLRAAVSKSTSVVMVLDILGIRQNGRNHTRVSEKIRRLNIDTSHMLGRGSNRGSGHLGGAPKNDPLKILSIWDVPGKYKSSVVARAMMELGIAHVCSECNLQPVWNGKKLTLQIDHRDGNRMDNTPKNVRFLCPNCHSQTDNFSGRSAKHKMPV